MPETYQFDPAHSSLEFSAKHLMVATVRGSFTDFSGQIEIDADDPTTARGEVAIKTASVSSGAEDRDKHLRSADFFDVERFPEMRFVSTAVEPKGGNRFAVRGDLTIKDVTRPVELTATVSEPVNDPWGNQRTGISLSAEINREDWGLNWNMALEAGGWLVSKQVRLNLDVVALKRVAIAA